ncbi:MAG TPA: hypothetical protein VGK64_07815 [Bryobacteraceae bacterium]
MPEAHHIGMVQASTASHFWATVEDCLVNFHHFERDKAAERVTTLWRQLPKGPEAKCDEPSFEDMIYHAEPWYIACNLAENDLPLTQYQSEYRNILRQNQLA